MIITIYFLKEGILHWDCLLLSTCIQTLYKIFKSWIDIKIYCDLREIDTAIFTGKGYSKVLGLF
jgi:hypothetical protein